MKDKKVEDFGYFYKKVVFNKFNEIMDSLRDEYYLNVNVSVFEISLILDEFYKYYESKGIAFDYKDTMISHFEDMANDAIAGEYDFNTRFVLEELKLYELLDSRVEVNPLETKKMVNKLKKKLVKEK